MLLAKWTPRQVDYERAEVGRDAASCTDAINFLFERGIARTRPHARNWFSGFGSGANVDFAKSILLPGRNRYTLYIQSNGALARQGSSDSATSHTNATITGGGTSFGDRLYHNICVASGDIVIGNNTGGMLVHTPLSSTTYSVVSDAKYRYFTTSFNRVVGAYDITSAANNPRSIGWSTTTDITDWTSTGAGSTELTDIPDEITGLVNVNNVVVVARQLGWTLGYVTGSNSTGPFRWSLMTRDGAGCAWPSTLASFNNMIFCVGHDDIYTFDINQGPAPIGRDVRERVLKSLASGARYKGVITKGDFLYEPGCELPDGIQYNFIPRLRYHLVPVIQSEGARHFSYDVQDRSWSTHTYNFVTREAFEFAVNVSNHPVWTLSFVDDSTSPRPQTVSWFDGQVGARSAAAALPASWPNEIPDQEAVLTSPVFLLNDSAERDYDVDRLMLVWALEGSYPEGETLPEVKLAATFQTDYKRTAMEKSLSLANKIEGRSGEWNRSWFDMRLNGNLLKLQLRVPAGLKLAIKQIEVHGKDSALSRAA